MLDWIIVGVVATIFANTAWWAWRAFRPGAVDQPPIHQWEDPKAPDPAQTLTVAAANRYARIAYIPTQSVATSGA